MKKIFAVILLTISILSSCEKDDDIVCHECDGWGSKDFYMWVDAEYGPCNEADTLRPHCLMVQFSDTYEDGAWQPFTQEICGFDFEPGIRYKLHVRKKQIENDTAYKYCLLQIVDKQEVFLK